MATYRHDLLVALRLINRMESNTIQAEYENWVAEENVKCSKLSAMLGHDHTKIDWQVSKELTGYVDGGGHIDDLHSWWVEYCGDCRSEQKAFAATFV